MKPNAQVMRGPSHSLPGRIASHLISVFIWIVVIELLVALSEHAALATLPAGRQWVLLARGNARWEMMHHAVLMALVGGIYTILALIAPKFLGCLVRGVFFILFTLAMFIVRMGPAIAVVETPDAIVFKYRFPLGSEQIEKGQKFSVYLQDRALTVSVSNTVLKDQRVINCETVSPEDLETVNVLNDLTRRLKQLQTGGK